MAIRPGSPVESDFRSGCDCPDDGGRGRSCSSALSVSIALHAEIEGSDTGLQLNSVSGGNSLDERKILHGA